MNMLRDQSVTGSHAKSVFGYLLERMFMVLQDGLHYKRFINFARLGTPEGDEAATKEFWIVWRVIARELTNASANVTIDEAIEICQQFFLDPADSSKDYSQIAIDVLWDDQPSFLTFRRERNLLEEEEAFRIQSLELSDELVREDLLRSLIQLAFLPIKLILDSEHLIDRQKATFAENLSRLINQYLPQSGLQTTVQELKTLILAEIPKLNERMSFLSLIDDYEEELAKLAEPQEEENEEAELIELTAEYVEPLPPPEPAPSKIPIPLPPRPPIPPHKLRAKLPSPPPSPPLTEVKVPTVDFDHQTRQFRVGEKLIGFDGPAILAAIGKIPYDLKNETDGHYKEFSALVSSLLMKVIESIRADKTRAVSELLVEIADFADMLLEVKEKLEPLYLPKFTSGENLSRQERKEMLSARERKLKCIVDSVLPAEAAANEMLPMTLRVRRKKRQEAISWRDPMDELKENQKP